MAKRARINFHGTSGAIGGSTWNDNADADYNTTTGFRRAVGGISIVDGTSVAVTVSSHSYGSMYPYFYFAGLGGVAEGIVGYRSAGGDTNTLYITVPDSSAFSGYTSGGYLYPAHIYQAGSTPTSLKDDTDGTATGWRLHGILPTPSGWDRSTTNGAAATGTGDASWIDDVKAAQHYWGGTSVEYSFLVSGLDNAKTYTIEYFGSRAVSDATGRPCRLTIGETFVDLNVTNTGDASGNTTRVASIAAISPSNGTITLSLTEQNTTNFVYVNALRITEADGASAVVTDPGLHGITHGFGPEVAARLNGWLQ